MKIEMSHLECILRYTQHITTLVLIEFVVPFSGICYGMQIIAKEFGGEIRKKDVREDGPTEVEVDPKCPLFE